MIDALMSVHNGLRSKDEVFNEHKNEYFTIFKKLNDQNDIIKSSNDAISASWDNFQNLKKSVMIDPTRQQFLQRIDMSLMC